MANTDNKPALKITLEDLAKVTVPQEAIRVSGGAAAGAARQYGNISTPAAEQVVVDEGKSNIFLQGWFYLGVAGLVGAVVGWGICEPWFVDGPPTHWVNYVFDFMMMPPTGRPPQPRSV